MSILETIKNKKSPVVSFEFFPPRNEEAGKKLGLAIRNLAALNPDFVSVTFGALGSTREGSYQLVRKLKDEFGLRVLPYFAGYGLRPEDVASVLDSYRDLGLETMLLVRGDRPRDAGPAALHGDSFSHASDLISFVVEKYNFSLGASCYPEGHVEAESLEEDLRYLKLKVKNGAQFLISQFFYDLKYLRIFSEKCFQKGIEVPILCGVMPIYSRVMLEKLSVMCGAKLPREMNQRLDDFQEGDKDSVSAFGIDYVTEHCRKLLKSGVRGLHFYTMNRSKSVVEIVKKLRSEGLLS